MIIPLKPLQRTAFFYPSSWLTETWAGPRSRGSYHYRRSAGALQQLLLPLARLDQVLRAVSGDLLERLATTDRLHGDPGLELGAVGSAFALGWEPLSGVVPQG